MKKSKKKIILLVVFLIIVVIYFGAKIVLINTLPDIPDYLKNAIEAFNNVETITIQKSTIPIEDYLTYEEMEIRNDFDDFVYEGQQFPTLHTIKNSDIRITISKESIDRLTTYVKENAEVPNLPYDLAKDLEKENITKDFELYKYLFQNVTKKVNIFSSFHAIKRAHTLYSASILILTNIQKVTLINGDYEGYILETNGDKTAYIYHGNNSYFLHIWSTNYSDEQLYDLISTIRFN